MKLFRASRLSAMTMTATAVMFSCLSLFYFSYWWLLASFVAFQVYWVCGVSVGYHRYFGHKCFQTNIFWREVLIWLVQSAVISHIGLSKLIHDDHHKYSDTDKDPHRVYGSGGLILLKKMHKRFSPKELRHMLSDPIYKRSYDYYLIYPLGTIAFLSLFGIEAIIYLWGIPVTLVFLFRKPVLVIWPHKYGYQTWKGNDNSRNCRWMALLFGGESLHNNHHNHPGRWNFAMQKGEIDPGSYFIRLIKK